MTIWFHAKKRRYLHFVRRADVDTRDISKPGSAGFALRDDGKRQLHAASGSIKSCCL